MKEVRWFQGWRQRGAGPSLGLPYFRFRVLKTNNKFIIILISGSM
ncbi:hypothetical protein LINPERHAP1_LOCUS7752 [Linum perenne]